jgi:L-lactate dehydrogenase
VHGESQVVAWSNATLCGVPIDKALSSNSFDRNHLANECKQRSQKIIQAKGKICFGIGSAISRICVSILFDKRNVYPISHFQPEWGCCFSLPVVLGRSGIIRTVQMSANSDERADIDDSVKTLSATLKRIRKDQ